MVRVSSIILAWVVLLLTNCLDSNADFVPAIPEHPDSSLLCYLLKPAFAYQPKSKV